MKLGEITSHHLKSSVLSWVSSIHNLHATTSWSSLAKEIIMFCFSFFLSASTQPVSTVQVLFFKKIYLKSLI